MFFIAYFYTPLKMILKQNINGSSILKKLIDIF